MFEESTGVLGLHELTTDAVCVCVLLIMRLGLPLLLFVYLFSSLLSVLHSSLPPFSSLPLLHLGFSCRASLHILLNKKKLSPDVFFFLSSYDVVGRPVLFLNSGLNTITTLNFEFSDSLKSICSESMCSVLKAKV